MTTDDDEFTHYLFVREDESTEVVPLRLCRVCALGFAGFRERDEYVRASYLA